MRGKKAFKRAMALLLSAVMGFTVLVSDANAVQSYAATANNGGIKFVYQFTANDNESAKNVNEVKYTIDFVDENGEKIENAPAYTGKDIFIDSDRVDVTASTFGDIKIDGYTFDDAYCFFYWEGTY